MRAASGIGKSLSTIRECCLFIMEVVHDANPLVLLSSGVLNMGHVQGTSASRMRSVQPYVLQTVCCWWWML